MSRAILHTGDAGTVLATLADASVRCCVTSPPYWGLRDYGQHGQLGLERTPEEYVAKLVAVFREVRRVLDGRWDAVAEYGGLLCRVVVRELNEARRRHTETRRAGFPTARQPCTG